jgi:Effector Associated Constant Component 1
VSDITLDLAEDGADPARLDLLTRQLRDELGHLALADVRPAPGPPAPPGARGLDVPAMSTLAVALMGSGGLTAVITAVRAWLDRGHEAPRSIRVEVDGDVLELSGATNAEQDRLVSLFLARHAEKGPSWTADAPH